MSIFGSSSYSTSGSGGGSIVRLLIGLVIAGIGVVSYFAHTEKNPITGQEQHVGMSVDQEMTLGLQAAPQMASEMGGVVDASDPREQTVQRIGLDVLSHSDAGRSPYADNFHFNLLRDNRTINAFSLPGGQVFITAALYDRLENEAQLAGVLGHETGHVIARHGAQQMATGQLGQSLVTAVAVGTSDRRNGNLDSVAAMMANQMLQLKYSRGDELEADSLGMRFMSQAGYDPQQMRRVMEILKSSAGGGRGPDIFATHPDPNARIAAIEQYLKDHYPDGVPGDLKTGSTLRGSHSINLESEP